MKQKLYTYLSIFLIAFTTHTLLAQEKKSADFFSRLETERVASEKTVIWDQVGPGNAGFANLLRYHPTIPELVVLCPDMWNIYQSEDNGKQWYNLKDSDGNGDFFHIRDLYYSPQDANFGLAIESSRMWKTEDLGKNWTYLKNCPWYQKDNEGYDKSGWKKKVASLAIDPNDKNTWFVGGGTNVRGQEWLSCYKTMTAAAPHGLTADNEGKLWRTNNGGTSWTLSNSGLHNKAQVGRIIVNPKNSQQVFASSNYGLYRSDNGGNSWTNISSGQLDNEIIMDMDFYYNKNSGKFILYAIDQVQYLKNGSSTKCTGGIFKSSDNGTTWTNISGDLGLDINQLTGGVSDNYYKYIAMWFGISVAEAKTTYPTKPTKALQIFNMISADPSREDALYVGFADPQIANSIVPGRLWTTSNGGQKWINTARLYEHVWENDKAYWTSRGNPYHENMKVGHESPHMQSGNNYALRSMRGLDVGIDGSVMIISDHSTMLSKDHGETWQQMDEDYTPDGNIIGHGNSNLPALHIAQDKRYETAILGSGEHRVWIPTNDSPDSRQALKFIESAQETVITMAFDPYDSKTIYGTSSRQAKKQNIFKSTDGGFNWANHGVATPATNAWGDDFYTNALTIDPIDNTNFYFGITDIRTASKINMGGFYYSDDQGKTFSPRNNGLPTPARIEDIAFDPRDPSRKSLFVAAEKNAFDYNLPLANGGLYHTSDRGKNWTKVNTPSSVHGVNSISIDHTNRLYITTGYRGNGDGIWYTDDFGTNWQQIFSYPGTERFDVCVYDHNLLVSTVDHLAKNPGVFLSKDRGLTWAKNNTNIASPNHIEDVRFDLQNPNELWLATLGSGFYKGKINTPDPVQVVKVTPKVIDFKNSSNNKLTAVIIQSKHSDKTLVWKSENTAVAKVDQNGVITATGKGNTKIWASTSDGRYADYATIIIHQKPISSSNFKIQSIGQTCTGVANGKITINTENKGNYIAKLTETNEVKNFTQNTSFENLAAGIFELTLNSTDQPDFNQTMFINIKEVEELNVSAKVNDRTKTADLDLSGAEKYTITLNGSSYETSSNTFQLALQTGTNKIEVKTGKNCQGNFTKEIFINDKIQVSPSPFSTNLKLYFPDNTNEKAKVSIYSVSGKLLYSKIQSIFNHELAINTSSFEKGIYILRTQNSDNYSSHKIVKN
ncbi:VPS10 domain-containing protein [Flavicella sediminum]|uniref:VPS10 domain-containing protein n=1 Tax=Flavicella sediminum TaxID=2585141 RepID=UPI0011201BCF|nr:T9SS type A sorting domain-containing protein [Flavicella sediminum]